MRLVSAELQQKQLGDLPMIQRLPQGKLMSMPVKAEIQVPETSRM